MSIERKGTSDPGKEFENKRKGIEKNFISAEARLIHAITNHDAARQTGQTPPDATEIIQHTHDRATALTDNHWLEALNNFFPDMSDASRLELFRIKEQLREEQEKSSPAEEPASKEPIDPFTAMMAEGTPEQELGARMRDWESSMAAQNANLRDVTEDLREADLTRGQQEVVHRAVETFGAISELRTDNTWVQSLTHHKADARTITHVWDTKNEVRSALGKRWEKVHGAEEQE